MKQIQQYCSAMDKIKHDPACKQEVLNMAQRNQIHMTKRSGKIAGTAIAAALLAANIGGGYRFTAIIIAFSINYAAYFAEIYRSGIESMSPGQYEAARLLGYSRSSTFLKIIFPQVIKRILPSVTNEVITLIKDTSLAFSLAYAEMFTIAKQIAAKETNFMPFLVAAVFYYVFNALVAFLMERLEKSMSYYT